MCSETDSADTDTNAEPVVGATMSWMATTIINYK